jgi:GalNAc5-diNAcBac-PP-undecaprenol beta-1,3-glucosyltransferase
MTDATILIPTYRHAALVPYSVRSALAQEGVAIEVFVVGDGVEDNTRAALEPFLPDPRVRFFDFPKGLRNGELSRHSALQEATGRIVCYLSDDDLFLPDHVAETKRLLADADFAHSAPLFVMPDGSLRYGPIDVARHEFQALLLSGGWNQIALTGAAHTIDAYRRLPHGWRPAPPDVWSDLYMWQQLVGMPGFRGRTGTRLTHLHLADQDRRDVPVTERIAELEGWWNRIQAPGFADELATMVADAVREAAIVREPLILQLMSAVSERTAVIREIEATRWWRLRTRLATSPPLRELLARRREAR